MSKRQRVAHSASFLQTFHTGLPYREIAPAEADPAAVAFVKGAARPARNDGSYVADFDGWKVKCGGLNITEKQAKWIVDIATTRDGVTDVMRESLKVRLEQGFAKSAGSQFIDRYKDLPRTQTTAMAEAIAPGASDESLKRPEVADGRYAVEHEGVLKFFKVKNGRKPGFVFLDIQASDEWHAIRNVTRITQVLALIRADEETAARRYGIELGQCGRCGRTLTDEESRAYGIGPVCREK